MNRRKIENWLIFCLKLLPFIFLLFFLIYFHRHDLPESIEVNVDTYQWFEYKIGDIFQIGDTITTDNVSDLQFTSLSYDIETIPNPVDGIMPYDRLTYTVIWYAPEDIFSVSLNVNGFYIDDIRISKFVFADPTTNGFENVSYIVNSTFKLHNIRINDLAADPSTLGTFGYYNNSVVYDEPFSIGTYYFSKYLDNYFNINFFNLNNFYDWINYNWFGNNPPLIFNIIFKVLVYELLIDLIYLLYSFITFIIKFAQKWLNGVYSKE